ncbi:hypothetical protein V6N11_075789 [Hibiscus sabdariffa]|uniref:Uncharacterized protein n=1 Tax=Hibiscus sabdariffa TaxID=183260 RepID=A0ABR2Q4A5_9ROSI
MLSVKKKTARRAAEAVTLTSYWKTLAIKPPPAAASSLFSSSAAGKRSVYSLVLLRDTKWLTVMKPIKTSRSGK